MTCRDDVTHTGERIDWGKWAITCDDPDFGGEGSQDTGDDYGPAPGETCSPQNVTQPLDAQDGVLSSMSGRFCFVVRLFCLQEVKCKGCYAAHLS